ncbi:MAG: DUF3098 domain-containing protein [Balneolaceae bacterium]
MSRKSEHPKKRSETGVLFGRMNYQWATAGCLLVFSGFLAMYLENEVYGWISLNLSPVLILGGYGMVLYAIIKKFDDRQDKNGSMSKTKDPTPDNG